MAEEKKGGMSKGCVVGLIVVGVIAVLVIVGGFLCWHYKDDLAKVPVKSVVTKMQSYLKENPVEGVDADVFNTVSDDFLQKIDAEKPLQYEKYSVFVKSLQPLSSKKEFTKDDYQEMMTSMVTYYPSLKDEIPPTEELPMEGTPETEDSMSTTE